MSYWFSRAKLSIFTIECSRAHVKNIKVRAQTITLYRMFLKNKRMRHFVTHPLVHQNGVRLFFNRYEVGCSSNVAEVDVVGTSGYCDVLLVLFADLSPVLASIPVLVVVAIAPVHY